MKALHISYPPIYLYYLSLLSTYMIGYILYTNKYQYGGIYPTGVRSTY